MGQRRILILPPRELVSIHHGHLEVEDDEIGRRPRTADLQRFLAVCCDADVVALVPKKVGNRFSDPWFIIHHQYVRGHHVIRSRPTNLYSIGGQQCDDILVRSFQNDLPDACMPCEERFQPAVASGR